MELKLQGLSSVLGEASAILSIVRRFWKICLSYFYELVQAHCLFLLQILCHTSVRVTMGILDVAKREGKIGGSLMYGWNGKYLYALKYFCAHLNYYHCFWCINGLQGCVYCQSKGDRIIYSLYRKYYTIMVT